MSAYITQPEHSFVRFDVEDHTTCNPIDVSFCLPMVLDDDVAFQFIVETDTEAEADELCDIAHAKIQVGIMRAGDDPDPSNWLINYFNAPHTLKPDRFRIGPNRVLYNWPHGAPSFQDVINLDGCFVFVVRVEISTGVVIETSNCFQRIADDCYTTVMEYSATKNAFGFIYCGFYEDASGDDSGAASCAAFIQAFSNQSLLSIPYTSTMVANYGDVPTVDVFIYDAGVGKFIKTIVSINLDGIPPTSIDIDLGGPASGYVKIY